MLQVSIKMPETRVGAKVFVSSMQGLAGTTSRAGRLQFARGARYLEMVVVPAQSVLTAPQRVMLRLHEKNVGPTAFANVMLACEGSYHLESKHSDHPGHCDASTASKG